MNFVKSKMLQNTIWHLRKDANTANKKLGIVQGPCKVQWQCQLKLY